MGRPPCDHVSAIPVLAEGAAAAGWPMCRPRGSWGTGWPAPACFRGLARDTRMAGAGCRPSDLLQLVPSHRRPTSGCHRIVPSQNWADVRRSWAELRPEIWPNSNNVDEHFQDTTNIVPESARFTSVSTNVDPTSALDPTQGVQTYPYLWSGRFLLTDPGQKTTRRSSAGRAQRVGGPVA